MMTQISDYILAVPPSGEDITGNIIPVADIDGKDATLRKEDYYYLRELWSVYRNDNTAYTTAFPQYGIRGLIAGSILYYLNLWKSDTYMTSHTHMKVGLPSYSFTGNISSSWSSQFYNWMKNNNAIVAFDGSPVSPVANGDINADVARYAYRFLTQDMFRNVRDTSYGGTRALTFTTETKSIPYSFVKLDSDDNIVSVSETGQIVGSGGYINANGISTNGRQIGMHSFRKYVSSESKYKYYNSVAFPTSTITADITFSAPVVEAYALMSIDIYNARTLSQGLQLLRPMTGSGVNWSVDFIKRSDYDLVTANLTLPTLDEWVDTQADVTYYHADIERVFARFADLYFELPSEWDWSPN